MAYRDIGGLKLSRKIKFFAIHVQLGLFANGVPEIDLSRKVKFHNPWSIRTNRERVSGNRPQLSRKIKFFAIHVKLELFASGVPEIDLS